MTALLVDNPARWLALANLIAQPSMLLITCLMRV